VGLNPTIPQKAAGFLTESPVSVPNANTDEDVATETAEPDEDPPACLFLS